MDFYGINTPRSSIRSKALEKLSCQVAKSGDSAGLARLSKALASQDMTQDKASIPMTGREYEVLIALGKSAGRITNEAQAAVLFRQLSAYFVELPTQKFVNSPLFRQLNPSPWQLASRVLTSAVVSLSNLADGATQNIALEQYIDKVSALLNDSSATDDYAVLFPLLFSLEGFLQALTDNVSRLSNQSVGLVLERILPIVDSGFLLKVERAVSSVTNRYGSGDTPASEFPLWAHSLLFGSETSHQQGALMVNYRICSLAREIAARSLGLNLPLADGDVTNFLLNEESAAPVLDSTPDHIDTLKNFATNQLHSLDEGSDYIELASPEKIDLALSVQSLALDIIAVAVYFKAISVADVSQFIERSLDHEKLILNHSLYLTVFKLGAYLCRFNPEIGTFMSNSLPEFVANPSVEPEFSWELSKVLTFGLKNLSQDSVVSVIYTLVNYLTPDTESSANGLLKRSGTLNQLSAAEGASLDTTQISRLQSLTGRNIITSVAAIGSTYGDNQIATLSSTVLTQKYGTVSHSIDLEVIRGLSLLAPHVSEKEFKVVLRAFYSGEAAAARTNDQEVADSIQEARCRLSRSIGRDHPLFEKYLAELLKSIIGKGDTIADEHHRSHVEISATAKEIATLIPPLALLLPKSPEEPYETHDWEMTSLFRNAWFNMVVHGFSATSQWTNDLKADLEIIARSTPPLVSETSANQVESELELNTVLRRGSSHHNVNSQKDIMQNTLAMNSYEVRSISYSHLMFLSAAVLLEFLRAETGECSKVLLYFGDPEFRSGDSGKHMTKIAMDSTSIYIKGIVRGGKEEFTADKVAEQLKKVLVLCCHRVAAIRDMAFVAAENIIRKIPSALCRRASLFALLDLMTLLWTSQLDADTDEYEPRAVFTAPGSNITLRLSDSYDYRKQSLEKLKEHARKWIDLVLQPMSFDLKSLLTSYLTEMSEYRPFNHVALGCAFALEAGGTVSRGDGELSVLHADKLLTSSGFLSHYIWRSEFKPRGYKVTPAEIEDLQESMEQILSGMNEHYTLSQTRDLLYNAATILRSGVHSTYIAQMAVKIPFKFFNERQIEMGISLWLWIMNEVPSLRMAILAQIAQEWEQSVKERKGLFSRSHDLVRPDFARMEYAPSNKAEIERDGAIVLKSFAVHAVLVRFLSSLFQASVFESQHLLQIFTRIVLIGLSGLSYASLHPFARFIRFELIKFALDVLDVQVRFGSRIVSQLRGNIVSASLTWFAQPPAWPYGGNRLKLKAEVALLKEVALRFANLKISSPDVATKRYLLLQFLNDDLAKISAWLDPLQQSASYRETFGRQIVRNTTIGASDIQDAWRVDSHLAIYLAERHKNTAATQALVDLISADPMRAIAVPEALQYFLSKKTAKGNGHVLYWTPLSPIASINLFLPVHGDDSFLLQYAMRSLESHDVNLTFFYVPQLVQSLRHDNAGYIEAYILEAAKISQLFAHQIIWNILANSYSDEESTQPDTMKPTLDRVVEKMVNSFTEEDRSFYEREFRFFNEVTAISGKLKPYIKKSKAEKKAKIDEEIAKIRVDVGVYLPSNPDGTVVAIDRKSGRPLQSHAKAPFLAKFKIRREVPILQITGSEGEEEEEVSPVNAVSTEEVWQGAIFKVGDDCRQDVLALQIISVFRSIFKGSGLDLYVFPYRVTATAPGCGVIDVLPNAISRDMLGREAVNGLYEYFTSKHGGEDSIEFQKARNNFVKSLAAYSVISYLIQFKDRHNGNIMYDEDGHILHIDFGFCFDIVPGGVRFEAAPFKLTTEMVAVMGGSSRTQAYRWFEELCVKAFLACRPYAETIIEMVLPMLDSGLPCFKETTIKKLRARFVLERSERDAAIHFKSLIKKSAESFYTKGYDEFQKITNGIPY